MPPGTTTPPRPNAPSPVGAKAPSGWLWSAVKLLVGALLYALAAVLVFLVIEHALSRTAAVVAVVLTNVLAPVALTQLLTPAFRRLDATTTFVRVLPGVAGLCALVTLVALPLSARGPVSQALRGVAERYPQAGPIPIGAVRLVGAALERSAGDAGVRDAGEHDAGPARTSGVVAARDAAFDAPDVVRDAALDGGEGGATDVPSFAETTRDAAVPDVVAAPLDASASSGDEDEHTLALVLPCVFPRGVIAADLEGDARDEVVLYCAETVHVFALSEGHLRERLRFAPVPPQGLEAGLGRPAVYDMDGDGRRDVVVCEHYTSERGGGRGGATRYAVNRGDGRYGGLVELDRLDGCGAVAIGDVTGDGRDELLVAHTGNPYQATLPQGDVTWFVRSGRTWARRGRLAVGRWPVELEVLDVSGDGVRDVIVRHDWDNSPPVVLPGSRAGLRAMDATLRAPEFAASTRVAGRFDLDDVPDTAEITATRALRLTRSAPSDAPAIREVSGEPVILPPQPVGADASVDADGDDDPDGA